MSHSYLFPLTLFILIVIVQINYVKGVYNNDSFKKENFNSTFKVVHLKDNPALFKKN